VIFITFTSHPKLLILRPLRSYVALYFSLCIHDLFIEPLIRLCTVSDLSFTSNMKLYNNPWTFPVSTEASLAKLSFSTVYIGNIKLTVALSPSSSNSNSNSNSPTGSTPTIATFSLSTASSTPVINRTVTPSTGTSSAQTTGRIITALTTVTLVNGSTAVSTLTTKSSLSATSSSVTQSTQGSTSDPSSSHSATISSNSTESNKVNVAAIIGGTLGGLALLGLILFSTYLYIRQRNRRARGEETRKGGRDWDGWKWPSKWIMRRSSVRKDIGVTEPESFIPDTLRQTSRGVMPRKIER
jgi:hypothetical protein